MKYGRFLFLIVSISFLFLVACSKEDVESSTGLTDQELENLNESGFPIVKDQITLEFLARQDPASNDNWNDVFVFNEYEKMTNIDINWKMVPNDSFGEQFNLAFGSGNLPDAFHSAIIGTADLIKYGEQGLIIPLNDLIDEFAPNFKKLMEEHPDIEKSVTMPDGNIYAFPTIGDPEFLSYNTAPMMYINEEWLNELGMDMPETTDEFYEYLKAVKEESPSGGEVEEIPFGAPTIGRLYDILRGSFGIANKGPGSLIDIDPETEDYRFYPITDEYKELLAYLNKLYSEELIEQNIFSIEMTQFLANGSDGKYGSTVWYSPTITMGEEAGSKFTGMPTLEGPNGDKLFVNVENPVRNVGAFFITNENPYPASTVKWIDYFYSDEGIRHFFMGIEGETYEIDENGEYVYMDHIVGDDDLSFTEQISKYFTFPGGGYPTMVKQEYFQDAESSPISVAAAEKVKDDMIEERYTITHTEEENKKLQGFGTDIEKYVEEMRDKFIAGHEPLSKWDEYVQEIENMNLDEYMDLKIKAIERLDD